ncbi:unnamed protein product [Anisakis simplex]|uniref:Uncharacterized protein n=1 Tax=Anisakis simplex TaxID=6269 RepID=A0A3P6NGF3_ANISI|nr:unnamed protein product [Anisakis simplex]
MGVVRRIEEERVGRMRREIGRIYNEYFASLREIAAKTLEILENRILPNKIKTPSALGETRKKMESPALFLPRNVPAGTGFTAVIEAHQVESLFALIRLMVRVPSLAAIIVVWSRGPDGLGEIPPGKQITLYQ